MAAVSDSFKNTTWTWALDYQCNLTSWLRWTDEMANVLAHYWISTNLDNVPVGWWPIGPTPYLNRTKPSLWYRDGVWSPLNARSLSYQVFSARKWLLFVILTWVIRPYALSLSFGSSHQFRYSSEKFYQTAADEYKKHVLLMLVGGHWISGN